VPQRVRRLTPELDRRPHDDLVETKADEDPDEHQIAEIEREQRGRRTRSLELVSENRDLLIEEELGDDRVGEQEGRNPVA
jgi:hypothetical protein